MSPTSRSPISRAQDLSEKCVAALVISLLVCMGVHGLHERTPAAVPLLTAATPTPSANPAARTLTDDDSTRTRD